MIMYNAKIIDISQTEAEELVQIARREMADSATGSVMIIEDEAIIAMDIETIVAEMGHRVSGIARTRDEAVKLGRATMDGYELTSARNDRPGTAPPRLTY